MPTQMPGLKNRPRSDIALQVADEVRAWLARRHITANRAAQKLGWSQPYISKRLNGYHPFDLDDLAQVADLLDVEVTAFFDVPTSVKAKSANRDSTCYPDTSVLTRRDVLALNPNPWPGPVPYRSLQLLCAVA